MGDRPRLNHDSFSSTNFRVTEFLNSLRDPKSGEPLQFDPATNALVLSDGRKVASVVDGLPRFVDDRHLQSFGDQWTTYEVAHEDEDIATFAAKTGVDVSKLKGLRVLDAGCGGGRYSKICAAAGAEVTGADHTKAIEKARRLCGDSPNANFLQADLKHLPLEPESFDFVFSIGVMHHDAVTRDVFDAVARFVKPGGRYSVWLYKRNQWWQEIINSSLRRITRRLPRTILTPLCHVGAILGGTPVVNRTLNKIVNFSAHPSYENRVCDTFDWWAPEYQHHHTVEELMDWFRESGFENLQELPPEKSGRFYSWAYRNKLLIGSGVNVTGIRNA